MPEELDRETLRWKIDKDIQLYQFYLDMSVKVAVFLMTVTGAMASYVLTNSRGHVPGITLLFPAGMNLGFAVLFAFSIKEAKNLFNEHRKTCKGLEISAFNMGPLKSVCQIFCGMCAVATIGLVLIACIRAPF